MKRSMWLAVCAAVVLLAPAAQATGGAGAVEIGPTLKADAPGGYIEAVMFYGVALITVVSALGVCVSKNIVRMATWLFGALGGVAVLYFLLAANFLGAIQLIVYAGGTLILLVFGVMLTSKSPFARFETSKVELIAAGVVCGALFLSLCTIIGRSVFAGIKDVVPGTAISAIGRSMMTTYLVPFEVAGVLLMIVMVGAAHLARQEK